MPFAEAAFNQQIPGVFEHSRAAADHDAITLDVQWWQTDIRWQFSTIQQCGHPSLMAKCFTRNGGVLDEFFPNLFAKILVVG